MRRAFLFTDGVGFEAPRHYGGWIGVNRLGMVGMRARAKELGGALEVESQPGQGTQISVKVPLFTT